MTKDMTQGSPLKLILAYLNVRERLVDETADDIGAASSRAAHEDNRQPVVDTHRQISQQT